MRKEKMPTGGLFSLLACLQKEERKTYRNGEKLLYGMRLLPERSGISGKLPF